MLNYSHDKKEKYRSLDDDWNPLGAADVFTAAQFVSLLDTAEQRSCWDFNTALGETIREKYESLMYKIFEVAKTISSQIQQPEFFWAAMNPIVGCNLAMSLAPHNKRAYLPMGGEDPVYIGTLMDRVKLFECKVIPNNRMLVGCGEQVKSHAHYGMIYIANV